MTDKTQEILELLKPLFKEAESKGLWFRSNYQGCEFSPQELRKDQAAGRFIWGPVNWTLFDPKTLLKDPVTEAAKITKHNEDIFKRIQG